MPYRNGTIVPNATKWTTEMEKFLVDNYKTSTNKELADHLGLRLTVTRNKMRELGLKRIEMEYWNEEMITYLKENYKTIGDVEMAEIFETKFPKNKKWRKQHIRKKRNYLSLHRTKEEIDAIVSVNSKPGGKSFTIDRNSSSLNMHPRWVAQQLAWRNKEEQDLLMQNPKVIEMGKSLILLNRAIKKAK